jgi:hypothetical protein
VLTVPDGRDADVEVAVRQVSSIDAHVSRKRQRALLEDSAAPGPFVVGAAAGSELFLSARPPSVGILHFSGGDAGVVETSMRHLHGLHTTASQDTLATPARGPISTGSVVCVKSQVAPSATDRFRTALGATGSGAVLGCSAGPYVAEFGDYRATDEHPTASPIRANSSRDMVVAGIALPGTAVSPGSGMPSATHTCASEMDAHLSGVVAASGSPPNSCGCVAYCFAVTTGASNVVVETVVSAVEMTPADRDRCFISRVADTESSADRGETVTGLDAVGRGDLNGRFSHEVVSVGIFSILGPDLGQGGTEKTADNGDDEPEPPESAPATPPTQQDSTTGSHSIDEPASDGLSGVEVAGIVVGSVFAIAVIASVSYYRFRATTTAQYQGYEAFHNPPQYANRGFSSQQWARGYGMRQSHMPHNQPPARYRRGFSP